MAVDDSSVYWTEEGGDVKKVSLGGGAVTLLATGAVRDSPIAVDGTNVYFIGSDDDAWVGIFMRSVPLAGGEATTLATGRALGGFAVDGESVYYFTKGPTKLDGDLFKVPASGGSVTMLASRQPISGLAVTDAHLYFASSTGVWSADGYYEGVVMRIDKNVGRPVPFAPLQRGVPSALAVDDSNVYWSSAYDDALVILEAAACRDGACQ